MIFIQGIVMIGKILSIILLSFTLISCGSSSETSDDIEEVQYLELEQYKGELQEPTIFDIGTRGNDDLIEINSYFSDEVDSSHPILIQYKALQEGEVALVLNSSSYDVNLVLTGEGIDQSSFVFSGNDAIVFSAVIGGLYNIRFTSTTSDVASFEFKITEANRSSLGLSDSEYWVNSTITDNSICDGIEGSNTYTYGQIFNFEQGYVAYSDGVKIAEFNVNDTLKFNYIETYPNDDGSYTYNYAVELNTEMGEVVGAGTFHNSFNGRECQGTSNYVGKIVL